MEAKLKWLTATNCTEFVSRKYHDLTDLIQSSNQFHKDIKYIPFAKFQEYYWNLSHSIKLINDQYGWQLLMGLLQNVMNFVIAPIVLIVQITNPAQWGPVDVKSVVICIAWLVTHLLYLFLMAIPPSYAAAKAEKTAVTICQHLNIYLVPDDMNLLEMFVLQLHKLKPHFTICGVVTLQRSTITTVIGVVITYLVIFIQFQNRA
ncbi:gustatory receptor for sugar taste 43a-like [Adelges cooleyi]|uniref:gustatory receptor for sugar taste 43a-like n=1 Tax=Adelges cooleyi TaxID=133065 RepID=UPI00217F3EF5|nr:gustatory receptor for sugar taste 43a-like [Adelges cooleyi]